MPVFSYIARDARQIRVRGAISADSPHQARESLRARALLIEELSAETTSSRFRVGWLVRKRALKSQVVEVLRELATLLAAGIDVIDAIEVLSRQHRGHMQMSLLLLRDRIASGARMAEAMAEQTHIFDELSIRMTEVGENAGNLDVVLEQLADFQERSQQLKDRVIGALLYPAIVFVTASGISVFLMTVVVPMLLTNLVEAGKTLPWPTRSSESDKRLSDRSWMDVGCRGGRFADHCRDRFRHVFRAPTLASSTLDTSPSRRLNLPPSNGQGRLYNGYAPAQWHRVFAGG